MQPRSQPPSLQPQQPTPPINRLRKILVPDFTELQSSIVLGAFLLLIVFNIVPILKAAAFMIKDDLLLGIGTILFTCLIVACCLVLPFLAALKKIPMDHAYKTVSVIMYYFLIALIAFFSLMDQLINQPDGQPSRGLFESLNVLITGATLLVMAIRGITIAIIARLGTHQSDTWLNQSLSNTQYRPIILVASVVMVGILIKVLGMYYDNGITETFLAIFYSLSIARFIEFVFPQIKQQPSSL